MFDVAGGRDNHIVRPVKQIELLLDGFALEAPDGVPRSKDRLAERMPLPEILHEEFVQHIEGDGQVLVEHYAAETDAFLRGKGIKVATDRIHRARDLLGRAGLSAFEYHVLDEMADAVFLRLLLPRAGREPDAQRDRAH